MCARPVSIAPLGGGTYALSLWLPNAGTWSLNVTLAGAPVAGRWELAMYICVSSV